MPNRETTKLIYYTNNTMFDPHINHSIPVWAIIYVVFLVYTFCKVLLLVIE